ncbi:acryloyl-CoA reductase [Herbiconiux moechotypicola]|uniref:Oxidoreductase n=1 Tax=Herbiconiux moechotypicola TaxID=637393 RepID=A0ABN3DE82_9MICO|nr:acryloyl-CoA reductase [Herbiconiux moechotypicola]MCS5729281.1 acryloyl-CoA reductase [Herbiconiux moechotypicola]
MNTTYTAVEARREESGAVTWQLTERAAGMLEGTGVLVRVTWSSLNFKDALALTGGKVVRRYPIVPGIDLAGEVVESSDPEFPVGAPVLAHGYTLGTGIDGGFAEYARVPAEFLMHRGGLSDRDAMAIGTAGFTAALSVEALLEAGIRPDDGPVLVTGASGGVGVVSVDLLAGLGYEVVASTGKEAATELLASLGAARVIGRLPEDPGAAIRALGASTWAGAVDSVGGRTLAHVLSTSAYGAVVAASGLTGGVEVPTTVMPFILRGVTLRGIDSVELGLARRRELWERLAGDLRPRNIGAWSRDAELGELEELVGTLLGGTHSGRTVIRVGEWRSGA